jgi:hypothetical protein
MVKPVAKVNPIRAQILGSLIEGTKTTRTQHTLVRNTETGKIDVAEVSVPAGFALRYPLAQNMSEHNVNVLAGKWIA